jgi:hypothetical protein
MPEIYDDDFIHRYEGAIILYETTLDVALKCIQHFPELPQRNLDQWTLTNATTLGGGLHRQADALYWVYPQGVAILVQACILQRDCCGPQMLRKARQRFNAILERWRRNR